MVNDQINLPVEQKIEVEALLPTIVKWQHYPDIALISLSGIVVPPHQRTTLYVLNAGYQNNINVSSRGTSKSATVATLFSNFKTLFFTGKKSIVLSYTGFRGGQVIFEDINRWLHGAWSSQKPNHRYFRQSIKRDNTINKSQNYWSIEYDSQSTIETYPTNDPDKLRGLRGTDLFLDEANFISKYLIDTVAIPFLSVKGDFEHGGLHADANPIYYTSTVDFGWRPFMEDVRSAKEAIAREYDAKQALKDHDFEKYDLLDRQGLSKHTFVSFDYTDLLIRTELTTRDGRRYKVNWPNPKIKAYRDIRGIPFSVRGPDGRMLRDSPPMTYYPTYPSEKELIENKLLSGIMDEASWKAENRNLVDTSTGDVYSYELIERASCRQEYCITPYSQTSDNYKKAFEEDKRDYVSPLMWECSDPCVLGVDYATQSDFSAFVVIRVGPCAEGEYNHVTHHGNTRWSNVIWAEQHKHTSHKDVADKIRQLMERYNLVWHHEPHELDPWKRCRAIGLDMRGGGSGVRDELAYINDNHVELPKFRIYDPQDKDPRIPAFAMDPNAKPMLDVLWPQGDIADKMVTFTIAQMENKFLYIPKFLNESERTFGHAELGIGYFAAANLARQLVKLRQEPTATWRRFYVEGDTDKDANKKDLWSAFMYAAKQLRAHVIRKQMIDEAPPPSAAIITTANKGGYRFGGAPGSRDNYRRGGRLI